MFRLALAAAATVSVDAAAITAWAKGGDLCAGIVDPCTTVADCTTVAFGPCANAIDGASTFLSSEFVGMAFLADGYLTDLANKAMIVQMDGVGVNGYRDFSAELATGDGGKYAYVMSGARFGDMSDSGGYAGVASYLNTGTTDIVTKTNSFRVGDETAKAYRTDQNTGPYGAPAGPYDVCIAEIKDGECGDARTLKPGEYKFSIFGYTKGASYPPPKGVGGVPEYTHLGVRMKLTANNFQVADIKINGDKTLADIGDTDVTKIELAHGSGTLTIDFPQKYNVGDVKADGPDTPEETLTISIKVSDASAGDAQAIFVDYLFAEGELNAPNKYFVYDPSVTEKTTTDDPGAPEDTTTSTTVADPGAPENTTTKTTVDDPGAAGENTTTTAAAGDSAMISAAAALAPATAVAAGAAALAFFA